MLRRRKLKDSHQRRERGDDAQDGGGCTEEFRVEDNRCPHHDLKGNGVEQTKPMRVEGTSRISRFSQKETLTIAHGKQFAGPRLEGQQGMDNFRRMDPPMRNVIVYGADFRDRGVAVRAAKETIDSAFARKGRRRASQSSKRVGGPRPRRFEYVLIRDAVEPGGRTPLVHLS